MVKSHKSHKSHISDFAISIVLFICGIGLIVIGCLSSGVHVEPPQDHMIYYPYSVIAIRYQDLINAVKKQYPILLKELGLKNCLENLTNDNISGCVKCLEKNMPPTPSPSTSDVNDLFKCAAVPSSSGESCKKLFDKLVLPPGNNCFLNSPASKCIEKNLAKNYDCSIKDVVDSDLVKNCISKSAPSGDCTNYLQNDFLPQIEVPNQKFYQGILFSMEFMCIAIGVILIILASFLLAKYHEHPYIVGTIPGAPRSLQRLRGGPTRFSR